MEVDAQMQAFIDAELEAFALWFYDEARLRILRRGLVVDRDLLNSLAVKTATNELQVWFKDHGRMMDMGAGRGYHKGKFMGAEARGQILKGRTPNKWYGPLAWGAVYGTLVNNLANKYVANVGGIIADAYRKG